MEEAIAKGFKRVIPNIKVLRSGSRAAATSKMERFVIIVNGWKLLTIITKRSILDVAAALDPLLVLYCVRNLKQRNKVKFDTLMETVEASSVEKNSSQSSDLEIYRERKGTNYDFGLAEATNDEDFLGKLNSLDRKWESLYPGFFQ